MYTFTMARMFRKDAIASQTTQEVVSAHRVEVTTA